ncbi:SufE family protein [Chelatococcus reniformis]|uniref:Cysteine desufuration protein SufE n=1 Tax=Chelatococcus reniformis TaxID=1494448 RepID=A0A916UIT0_9HYPH|nr:SufE family protein [Chelatococcus reniformis]GGC73745.1 cysteine desufuration protein SufE [Chelatococcus reniformis]
MPASIDTILDDFAFLDEWEDRYRYLIELGRTLEPLPDEARSDANKVRGCASQVWLDSQVAATPDGPHLTFRGDSDAHIVRGLIAVTLAFLSGRPARDIVTADTQGLFAKLGLAGHLTPQRSNGLRSMVDRIKHDAATALSHSAAAPA